MSRFSGEGRTALIGHTGFVGSNIARQREFDDVYNTTNIGDIVGQNYDLVVSAAGRADSHRINQAPDDDRVELERYADLLSSVSIGKLVHVSTVCVFDGADRCDEDTACDPDALTPYGRNRLRLEQTLADRFDALILRLPQLFGPGMKKGLVYDLANDHRIEYIRPDDAFQYYDLARLASDIDVAFAAGLSILNVATEPIQHLRLAQEVFDIDLREHGSAADSPLAPAYTRNMITKHADLFGGSGDYIMSLHDEIEAIKCLVDATSPRRSSTDTSPSTGTAGMGS